MSRIVYIPVGAAVLAGVSGFATTYHTMESAQKACFPQGGEFIPQIVQLTPEQKKAIEKDARVRVRLDTQRVWKVVKKGALDGWFLVDEVMGKHEFILYALALKPDGSIQSIEIMEYRENYGHQVRDADWRAQFLGKKHGASLKLGDDIKNVSGATLSCRHVTEGVRRLLAFHEIVLKNQN